MRSAVQTARGRTTNEGIFARIVEALHSSRQIEAKHLLRRYRHLIAEEFQERPNNASADFIKAEEGTANADRDKTLARPDGRVRKSA